MAAFRLIATGQPVCPRSCLSIQNAGSNYLGLRLRTDMRACFQFTAQRSENLTSWTSFTPVTVTSTPGLLLVRETLAESTASRSFLRLRLSPAP